MTDEKGNQTFSARISDLNEADRPRERALRHGIESLKTEELLAILLGLRGSGGLLIQPFPQ